MTSVNSTTVTVDFSPDGGRGRLVVLEESPRDPEDENHKFFRVHGGQGAELFATSGRINKIQSGLKKFTSEFINFNVTRHQELQYPNATNVKITAIGFAFNEKGERVPFNLSFDAANNRVVSEDIAIIGTVLVEYKAPYDLWRATFSGVCPSVESFDPEVNLDGNNPDDDRPYEGRDPMGIFAIKNSVIEASLFLEPPPCEEGQDSSYTAQYRDDVDTPRLVIEIDPQNPIRYTNRGRTRPESEVSLRVYPAETNIRVGVSSGTLGVNRVKGTREVKERITFSGRSSVALTYPPMNRNIQVSVISDGFIDNYGRRFTPNIRLWGDTVTSVTRVSKFQVTDPIRRKVKRGEVVITNMFGNTIDCYGALEVTYIAEYWKYEFEFSYDSKADEFKDTSIVASLDEQTQTLNLSGPRTSSD